MLNVNLKASVLVEVGNYSKFVIYEEKAIYLVNVTDNAYKGTFMSFSVLTSEMENIINVNFLQLSTKLSTIQGNNFI